jgi:hypothetical protein
MNYFYAHVKILFQFFITNMHSRHCKSEEIIKKKIFYHFFSIFEKCNFAQKTSFSLFFAVQNLKFFRVLITKERRLGFDSNFQQIAGTSFSTNTVSFKPQNHVLIAVSIDSISRAESATPVIPPRATGNTNRQKSRD